jgi:hypothetical protein
MEDWQESSKKKKEGVVIAFDESGAKAASLLHEDLIDLKVDMKPLYKSGTNNNKKGGENFEEYKNSLENIVLLVVLRTVSYGKESKNAIEVKHIKDNVSSTLVLDLCADGETPHLSSLIDDELIENTPSCQVYRTPGGWDPAAEEIPTGISAHVVNFMIAEQSKSASYNEDISSKFAATSNAKPRRLSLIDFDALGEEENGEGHQQQGQQQPTQTAAEIAADEETFQRFRKEEAEDEDQMDEAFQRFQMEQGGEE